MAHLRQAAFVEEVDDELHLVHAFEVRHLGRIARFDERLEASSDQRRESAAQHGLLAEEIRLGFFFERGLENAGASAADADGIGQCESAGVSAAVLMDRDETRHAATAGELAAHEMSGSLRRDHEDVDVVRRNDFFEVHAESVREGQRGAGTKIRRDLVSIDARRQLVGDVHHHDVGDARGLGCRAHGQSLRLSLRARRTILAQADDDFVAGFLEIVRVRVSLAAIADHRDHLSREHVAIDVLVIKRLHGCPLLMHVRRKHANLFVE